MREYRKTEAGQAALAQQRLRTKARQRALADLAELHPGEFDSLLTMHLDRIQREEQDQQ
jgi:hypothetical protein